VSDILETLSIPVIRHAFLAMVIAGGTLSLLGVVIVSLHLTAIRFTLMHIGLLGAAAGMSLGISPAPGAFVLVLVASLLMGITGKRFSISASSVMGLFMTGSLAAAFLLLAVAGVPAMAVFGVFAGNILLLTRIDLIFVAVLGAAVVTLFIVAYREIELVLLDDELARALGVPVDLVTAGLFVLVGAGVAAALRLVGALLVDGIILLPGIAALRFARGFGSALILSAAFGILSAVGGFLGALVFDLPVGASAAAASTLILAASVLVSKLLHRSQ
jgi:zinc transport system permease protein